MQPDYLAELVGTSEEPRGRVFSSPSPRRSYIAEIYLGPCGYDSPAIFGFGPSPEEASANALESAKRCRDSLDSVIADLDDTPAKPDGDLVEAVNVALNAAASADAYRRIATDAIAALVLIVERSDSDPAFRETVLDEICSLRRSMREKQREEENGEGGAG